MLCEDMAVFIFIGIVYAIGNAHAQSQSSLVFELQKQFKTDVSEVLNQAFSKEQFEPRLLGGSKAGRYEYPWQVVVTSSHEDSVNGVLLNEWTVLAPASEFLKCRASFREFHVEAGASKGFKLVQTRKVETFVMHGEYADSYEKHGSNLVLIYLQRPFEITKAVKPVRLSDGDLDKEFLVTGNCMLSSVAPNAKGKDTKVKELQIDVISTRQCKDLARYMYPNFIDLLGNRRSICGISDEPVICDLGSGSPLVCYDGEGEARLVGVSLVQPYECLYPPYFFTKVSKYRKWLVKTAKGEILT